MHRFRIPSNVVGVCLYEFITHLFPLIKKNCLEENACLHTCNLQRKLPDVFTSLYAIVRKIMFFGKV